MSQIVKNRVLIMAAGPKKEWKRHEEEIGGETLLARTVRILREQGFDDIFISRRMEDMRGVPALPVRYVSNEYDGNDLGCMYGVRTMNAEVYLFGDVYYTEKAIVQIMTGRTEFYGRSGKSAVKRYGEMFAVKATPKLIQTLERMWREYQSGSRKRLWSWDLLGEMQGKNFYTHGATGVMTEINDGTEDFDKPEELEKWKQHHEQS